MSLVGWLGANGGQLTLDHPGLAAVKDVFDDVLAPGADGPIPVVVHHVDGAPGASRTFSGVGALWDDDDCRFRIRTDDSGNGVALAAFKRVVLIDEVELPGIDHDTFWMVLEADTEAPEGVITLADGSRIVRTWRHLFGEITIAGRRQLVRMWFQGDDLIAEVDLASDAAGSLSDVEHAALTEAQVPTESTAGVAGLDLLGIAAMLGTAHDPQADLQWLPPTLQRPDLLTLDRFGFILSPNGAANILDVSATLGVAESTMWTPIPGFPALTVGELIVTLGVRHPLDGRRRRPHVALAGVVGLGDSRIDVRTRWPDLAVSGQLEDAHPLLLADLLSAVHLPPMTHGPAITTLVVDARPTGTQKSLSLRAAASDLFKIPVGSSRIELAGFELALDLRRGQERTLDADVSATLDIAGVRVVADARTVHDSDGWDLSARLGGDPIRVDALEGWINDRFGQHSIPDNLVAGEVISDLRFGYHTGTGDSSFHIVADFGLGGSATAGQMGLDLTLAHHGGDHYERVIGGRFTLGDYAFTLVDASESGAKHKAATPAPPAGAPGPEMLVGTFRHHGPATVGDLLAAAGLPLPIGVDVTAAVIGHSAGATLLLLDMAAGYDLSTLPLVGPMLTGDTTLGFALRVLATSGHWDAALVQAFGAHLDADIPGVPPPEAGATLPEASLLATVTIAGEAVHLPELGVDLTPEAKKPGTVPEARAKHGGGGTTATPSVPVQATGAAGAAPTWVPVQRSLGPVHSRRLGVHIDTGGTGTPSLEVLLDADLVIGGFTLSLEGLGVSGPLDGSAPPTVSLTGLGLDVSSDAYEIGGTFLRTGPADFAGAATIRSGDLMLAALGQYGTVAGHPSVVLYAVLDYPIGGPAFCYVTGLAAGFGYNRRLHLPTIDTVAQFPLVADAVAGAANSTPPTAQGIGEKISSLAASIPPSAGDLFFALGVRFNSFKLIDSFVLAAVSIASDVRIDVLGLSTMVLPSQQGESPGDPLAEVQVALHAQILPTEGFVGVDAQLTSASYVLSRNCHLRGGAAFYAWFSGEHDGDFVATLGGYHPRFRAPSHYPRVPRLSFDWHVSRQLSLKGSMYCALTPDALMAGGALEATYADGPTHASFRVGADFLLSWQPFHYEASLYVSIAGSWFFIHGEFGAALDVWGPDFSGRAEVDFGGTHVSLHFGQVRAKTTTVPWLHFRASSLPAPEVICGVVCRRGLLQQIDAPEGLSAEWVVSAHDLVLEATSQVPVRELTFNGGAPTTGVKVGAGPVGVDRGKLTSKLSVAVTKQGGPTTGGEPLDLRTTPSVRPVPRALWGDHAPTPDPNGAPVMADALVGHSLRPGHRPPSGMAGPFAKDTLGLQTTVLEWSAPSWTAEMRPVQAPLLEPTGAAARSRVALLAGLGIDSDEIQPGGDVATRLLVPPVVGAFTGPQSRPTDPGQVS